MFTILLRKMRNTRWMVLCLFIGFLMAAGMMSTVPIYMDASLQRMLIKDMEAYQLDSGNFPGTYNVSKEISAKTSRDEQSAVLNTLPGLVEDEVRQIGVPVTASKTVLTDNLLYVVKGSVKGDKSYSRAKIVAMTDFFEHVVITEGRAYVEGGVADDGAYEVLANERTLKTLEINLGGEYTVEPVDEGKQSMTVRVVGIYEQSDELDVYWSETMTPYLNALIVDYDCFSGAMLSSGNVALTSISVNYGLSYHQIDMNKIASITDHISEDITDFAAQGYKLQMDVVSILEGYVDRAASLTRILWIIQIPTMVMLGFYLFMVSQLNVEQERNEIAVFKSRGASSGQIFGIYAAEMLLLGALTLVAAPFIGLLLCQLLGVSNGFLEFAGRTAIAAKVTGTAVLYALLAVVVFFVTTMVPILPASRLSIVQYKQSRSRALKMPLWEKLCIDLILIAAGVGFWLFHRDSIAKALEKGSFSATGEIDPLIFVFSAALVMGLGLLFVRIYPYLLKLVYTLGKPFWSPSQYIAVTSVCRSQGGKERFLMLFLVVTFSFGLFYANTARAINNNKSDRIYYSNGADIMLKEYWLETTTTDGGGTDISYKETDFTSYEGLAGAELATKVLRNEATRASLDKTTQDKVTLMAVEPDKFAETAWFRHDLLPVHWWNYCNALVDYRSGVLISPSLAAKLELELGDDFQLKWGKNDPVTATVLAIVDYWPGINPYADDGEARDFAVMNYSYVKQVTELEPYEIWLKMEDGATSEALYQDIKDKKLPIQTLLDSSQMLIAEKTEPMLQGMNGALTLGFIIIMIMTVIGFLIYWILSIRSRTLQFGILRAMGVTFREIVGILAYEQVLVSIVSIAAAFVIGGVASGLFVPLFQYMYDIAQQIPPFRVAALRSDYIKIYAIIAVMLAGGFVLLGRIIRKININKALKLGED